MGLCQVDVAWSPFGAGELATPEEPGLGAELLDWAGTKAADEGAD
jgi:hypothetical protein